MNAEVDHAKINSEKYTGASIRPELFPKLLFGMLIRKMSTKHIFFLCPPVLSAPIITMGTAMEKEQKWEIKVFS